jgi:hypothetical protein
MMKTSAKGLSDDEGLFFDETVKRRRDPEAACPFLDDTSYAQTGDRHVVPPPRDQGTVFEYAQSKGFPTLNPALFEEVEGGEATPTITITKRLSHASSAATTAPPAPTIARSSSSSAMGPIASYTGRTLVSLYDVQRSVASTTKKGMRGGADSVRKNTNKLVRQRTRAHIQTHTHNPHPAHR